MMSVFIIAPIAVVGFYWDGQQGALKAVGGVVLLLIVTGLLMSWYDRLSDPTQSVVWMWVVLGGLVFFTVGTLSPSLPGPSTEAVRAAIFVVISFGVGVFLRAVWWPGAHTSKSGLEWCRGHDPVRRRLDR
jgi:hypothetical protein